MVQAKHYQETEVAAITRFGTATTYYDNNGVVPNKVKYGGRAIVKNNSPCFQVGLLLPSELLST